MKLCPKCNSNKNENEFNKNSLNKDGLQRTCRECTKKEQNLYYENNSKHHQQKVKNYQLRVKKEEIDNFKADRGCVKCGEKKWYVLDFHHIDPSSKLVNIGEKRLSKGIIVKERKKCIILCKNCHAEFHHLERQNKTTIQEYLK